MMIVDKGQDIESREEVNIVSGLKNYTIAAPGREV